MTPALRYRNTGLRHRNGTWLDTRYAARWLWQPLTPVQLNIVAVAVIVIIATALIVTEGF